MKKISLCCCLIFITTNILQAQRRSEERKKEREEINTEKNLDRATETFASYVDKDFDLKTAPEKWKNESAVILCQNVDIDYANHSESIISGITGFVAIKEIRKRVLLNDKNAVEKFSTLYTELDIKNRRSGEFICIKVIKPNGTEKLIPTSNALESENEDVPSYYKGYYKSKNSYYKLAIPDLEVGDIIDYVTYELSNKEIEFYYELQNQYPCVKQKLNFTLDRSFYIAYNSSNGAGKLKPYDPEEKRRSAFSFVDSMRDAMKDEQFFINRYEIPTIKVKVFKATRSYYDNFSSENPEEAKTSVSKEDILRKANNILSNRSVDNDKLNSFITLKRKYHNDLENKDKLVELMYNTLRQFRNMYYTVYSGNSKVTYINRYSMDRWDDEEFMVTMLKLMNKYDITCSVVAVPIRTIADKNTIAFANELLYVIKYKDKYLYPPTLFSTSNIADVRTQGQDAFLLKLNDKNSKFESIVDIKMPISSADENVQSNFKEITLKENMETFAIADTTYCSGIFKWFPDFNLFTSPKIVLEDSKILGFDYESDEYGKKEMKDDDEIDLDSYNERKRAKMEEKLNKEKEGKADAVKNKRENLVKEFKKQFGDVQSVDTAFIANSGRVNESDLFSNVNIFSTNNYIKKLGSNYSLEISKLIGSQKEINQNEMERKYNIYIDIPKTFNNKIIFTIPNGYKIEGLENLNFNVDNKIGLFKSSAIIQGNKLIINSNKQYKIIEVPKEDWKLMQEFLDAAFNFTQKKLILKKI